MYTGPAIQYICMILYNCCLNQFRGEKHAFIVLSIMTFVLQNLLLKLFMWVCFTIWSHSLSAWRISFSMSLDLLATNFIFMSESLISQKGEIFIFEWHLWYRILGWQFVFFETFSVSLTFRPPSFLLRTINLVEVPLEMIHNFSLSTFKTFCFWFQHFYYDVSVPLCIYPAGSSLSFMDVFQ